MGYFDDIPVKGSTKPATSTKSTGGYFADIPKPEVAPKVPLTTKAKDLGAGVLKSVLKLPARLATNLTQSAQIATGNKPTEPFSGKLLGRVEPVGRGQDLNAKSLGDAIGAGVEAFSYMPLVRSGKVGFNTIKNLGKAKVPIAELAREGAVGGLFGSLGSQIQEQASGERQGISAKELATATAVGTALNPLIGVLGNQFGKRFGKPVRQLDITSRSEPTKVPISTPSTRYADYRQSQGYEPYIPPEQLPVIEMGTQPKKQVEPTIKEGTPFSDTGIVEPEIRYEPIKDMPNVMSTIVNKGKNAPEVRQSLERTVTETAPFEPKQVPITGDSRSPAITSRIELDAIEKGITTRFENIPEVAKMNMRDQAEKATTLTYGDYEKAKRIAMGSESAPGDLRDGSVFEAVKTRALKENDVDTLRRLATESSIPARATQLGQEIKAFDSQFIDTTDPVELMQSIIKSREKGLVTKSKVNIKKQDVADVKSAIKRTLPKKGDLDQFISDIIC